MALQTLFMPGIAKGRLTLASGTPVTTTDQTAKTTVYFTPFRGNLISLYDGANWAIVPFTEASVAVPSTLFKCFDVFGYLSSGALAIETLDWSQTTGSITAATNATPVVVTSAGHGLSVGDVVGIASMAGLTSLNTKTWHITAVATDTFTLGSSIGNGAYTSGGTWYKINNSRATALVTTTGGVYTKSGDATRLYLGTGCTTGTSGQTEDSYSYANQVGGKRLIWNYWNRVSRLIGVQDTTANWTYTTTAYRQANGIAGNRVECVIGLAEDILDSRSYCPATNTNPCSFRSGVGVDSVTVNSSQFFGGSGAYLASGALAVDSTYRGYVSAGYHFLAWLENSQAAGTTTWYGSNAGATIGSGLLTTVLG